MTGCGQNTATGRTTRETVYAVTSLTSAHATGTCPPGPRALVHRCIAAVNNLIADGCWKIPAAGAGMPNESAGCLPSVVGPANRDGSADQAAAPGRPCGRVQR